jgi:hypothetical protein
LGIAWSCPSKSYLIPVAWCQTCGRPRGKPHLDRLSLSASATRKGSEATTEAA